MTQKETERWIRAALAARGFHRRSINFCPSEPEQAFIDAGCGGFCDWGDIWNHDATGDTIAELARWMRKVPAGNFRVVVMAHPWANDPDPDDFDLGLSLSD